MCVCCGYYFCLLSLLRLDCCCCCCFCFCFSCCIPVLFLLSLMLHWQHTHTQIHEHSHLTTTHVAHASNACGKQLPLSVLTPLLQLQLQLSARPSLHTEVCNCLSVLTLSLSVPLALLRLTVNVVWCALSLLCSALLLSPVDLLLLSVLTRGSGLTVIAAVVWHLMVKFEHFFINFFFFC